MFGTRDAQRFLTLYSKRVNKNEFSHGFRSTFLPSLRRLQDFGVHKTSASTRPWRLQSSASTRLRHLKDFGVCETLASTRLRRLVRIERAYKALWKATSAYSRPGLRRRRPALPILSLTIVTIEASTIFATSSDTFRHMLHETSQVFRTELIQQTTHS